MNAMNSRLLTQRGARGEAQLIDESSEGEVNRNSRDSVSSAALIQRRLNDESQSIVRDGDIENNSDSEDELPKFNDH